jgi:hypothetical protein
MRKPILLFFLIYLSVACASKRDIASVGGAETVQETTKNANLLDTRASRIR